MMNGNWVTFELLFASFGTMTSEKSGQPCLATEKLTELLLWPGVTKALDGHLTGRHFGWTF